LSIAGKTFIRGCFFVILQGYNMPKNPEKISKEEVKRIAALARLSLSEEEVIRYARELSAILGYVSELQKVDTENIRLTNQVTGQSNVTRQDKVDGWDKTGQLVKMAPSAEGGLVKVKAVFD